MNGTEAAWRTCSSCKGDIGFDEMYYVCSVSTCNRKGTDLRFCSVECWDAHVPIMRHRDAWAEEKHSPKESETPKDVPPVHAPSGPPSIHSPGDPFPAREILIVTSKLKAYVRARSGMNTSDAVMEVLSDQVRQLCDRAIANAEAAGRRTVMDRDFEALFLR